MMENNNLDNRFNKKAAKWHGLLWLCILVLLCLSWSLFLTGCSSHKGVVREVDSTFIKKVEIEKDSVSRDSSVKIEREKEKTLYVHDSVVVSQTVETTIIIRQDSTGKELSRETNTIITNNRDKYKDRNLMLRDQESSNVQVNNHVANNRLLSNDSASISQDWGGVGVTDTQQNKKGLWERISDGIKLILEVIEILVTGLVFVLCCIFFYKFFVYIRKGKDNG